jgi:hypothetical protein
MSSKTEDKIDALIKAYVKETRGTRDILRETAEHDRSARRVASAQRQKVLEQVLAKSGVDLAALLQLHTRSEKSDNRFYEGMAKRINENSSNIARQQKIKAEAFGRFRPPHHHPGNQTHAGAIITTADTIEIMDASHSIPEWSRSIAPQENIIRFHLGTEDFMVIDVATVFTWKSPISGTLDVIGLILPNGSWRYSSQYKCIEAVGELNLGFYLMIGLNGANFDPNQCDSDSSFDEYWDSYSHVSGSGIVSEPIDLEMQYPVQAGDEITLAVVTHVYSWASESHSDIDFASVDKQINIPGVIFNVYGN